MRAKRSFGQNFLQDAGVIDRIVETLALDKTDIVIEIGPGKGAMTAELLNKCGHVVAIELDRDLIPELTNRFAGAHNFTLINEDALTANFEGLLDTSPRGPVKLAANLPYNISTPILQRLMEHRELFSSLVLMFQKEVVERITARPGNSDRGFLSVLVENAFDTEYLFDVPPAAFSPVPKVWSAVVRLTPQISRIDDEKAFRSLLSRAFGQKRKTLLNNLRSMFDNAAETLNEAGINPGRRAETLSLNEWKSLADISQRKSRTSV
jgi:16S rRNA (adenine1518-N6/adenine1519-N6)-dimethyltransferase